MMTAPSLTQAQVLGNLFGSNSEGISIKTYTFNIMTPISFYK